MPINKVDLISNILLQTFLSLLTSEKDHEKITPKIQNTKFYLITQRKPTQTILFSFNICEWKTYPER